MQGYELFPEVFVKELRERFESPEFQQRVSLFGQRRGRTSKRRSERRVVAEPRIDPRSLTF
jgi:hypothetical protein